MVPSARSVEKRLGHLRAVGQRVDQNVDLHPEKAHSESESQIGVRVRVRVRVRLGVRMRVRVRVRARVRESESDPLKAVHSSRHRWPGGESQDESPERTFRVARAEPGEKYSRKP